MKRRFVIPLGATDDEVVQIIHDAANTGIPAVVKALRLLKHYGPGPHPDGSPQSAHGGDREAKPETKTPKTPKGVTPTAPAKPKVAAPQAQEPGSSRANPIYTDDVEVAAQAIADGKYVELEQERTLSTLVDKLGEMVADAEKTGNPNKTYDLCKATVKGTNLFCAENKGFTRIQMPQLSGPTVPGSPAAKAHGPTANLAKDFIAHLRSKGVKVTHGTDKAAFLKATQSELIAGKVAGIAKGYRAGTYDPSKEPIFVSNDGYIIDGHHRWAAVVAVDLEDNKGGDLYINVNRVDMSITDAMSEANRYATAQGIAPKVGKALTRILKAGFAPSFKPTHDDDDQNLVFGWANIAFTADGEQVSDLQGHLIDIEDLEEAAYGFAINYRKTGEMHTGDPLGDMIESLVVTPAKKAAIGSPIAQDSPLGWWVGFRVPPETFTKVKDGTYSMFSIQGHAKLNPLSSR